MHREEPTPVVEPLWRDETDAVAEPGFRLGYRPDIEGLRAVAVSLVVAAHAGVSWLQGGFIGVDVFFVLSGYLITGLLLQEYSATRRLRLLDFYARRLRRLLPALLVTVLATMAASAVLLSPTEQILQILTVKAAMLWASNLLFAFGQLDYFGPAAESNVLLHTWSLGVEEQFYLAWPLLMLFLFGAFAKERLPPSLRRAATGTAILVVVCFLLGVMLTSAKPMWAFYLPFARAWQFGTGALALFASVCVSAKPYASGIRRWRRASVAGWGGLALVIGSALLVDRQTAYPGAWALLPTLGTALVLLAGASLPHQGAGRLLSSRPLEWIGRRSYGWYLWHWPVLVLGATLVPSRSPAHTGLLVAISLVLAAVSFTTIENPIRHARAVRARPGLVMALSVAAMGIGLWSAHGLERQADTWAASPEQSRFVAVEDDKPFIYAAGCDDWYHSAEVRPCVVGDGTEAKTVVVIGDSVVAQWVPALAAIYRQMGWRFVVITKSACPMVDEQVFSERLRRRYVECEAWRNAALQALGGLRPDTVILGSSAKYPFGEREWIGGTARVLSSISASAERVFLIGPMHALSFDGPDCLSRAEWRSRSLGIATADQACQQIAGDPADARILAWLRAASGRFENVRVLDLNDLVCPDGMCRAERAGKLIFRDTQHLAASFVETLALPLAARLSLLVTPSAPVAPVGHAGPGNPALQATPSH